MKHQKIVLSSHVSSVYAPTKPLVKYLIKKFSNVSIIYHPFSDLVGEPSTCALYVNGNLKEKSEAKNTKNENANYPLSFLLNFYFILSKKNKYDLFIGMDCLNAICGIILRKIGIVDKVIFYTVDYARIRFKNKIMNNVYHLLDKICVKNSDYVWNVSKRICNVRMQQGLVASRNFLVPNGVHIDQVNYLPPEKITKESFFYVGHLKKEKGIHSIITSMPKMIETVPSARLIVIGGGSYRRQLEDIVNNLGLQNHVFFLGSMTNENILKEIVKYGIGLAPYTSSEDYNFYCNPVKVKEYLAAGCPVIITDVPDISLDVKKYELGFVIKEKDFQGEFIQCAIKILRNSELYERYRRNALEYASKYDWDMIYDQSFKRVIVDEAKSN
jgi:glycosyltransferase involved in cell wall biosynthesis